MGALTAQHFQWGPGTGSVSEEQQTPAGQEMQEISQEGTVSGPWMSIWARHSQWPRMLQALWFGYLRKSVHRLLCSVNVARGKVGFRQGYSQASVGKHKYTPRLGWLCFYLFHCIWRFISFSSCSFSHDFPVWLVVIDENGKCFMFRTFTFSGNKKRCKKTLKRSF